MSKTELLQLEARNLLGAQRCREVLFAPDGTPQGEINTDLDGTILRNGEPHDFGKWGTWEIPLETILALRRINESGVGLSAITGKTWEKAQPLFEAMTNIAFEGTTRPRSLFTSPCKLEEGGVIWDPRTDSVEDRIAEIDLQALGLIHERIIRELDQNNGRIIHHNGQSTHATLAERGRTSLIVWDYGNEPDMTVLKDYESILPLYQALVSQVVNNHKLSGTTLVVYDIGGDGTFSIHPASSSKAQITRELSQTNEVAPLERTVFMCNGINDVELAHVVRAAGGGIICPDDAHPDLLKIADIVGTGGAGYGIANALKSIFQQ